MISKIFKNYQSFVNNLYYEFPKVDVKTKHEINYVKYLIFDFINFLISFRFQILITKLIFKELKLKEIK